MHLGCRDLATQPSGERHSRDTAKLDAITREITLAEALTQAPEIIAGKVRGRLVVNVNA